MSENKKLLSSSRLSFSFLKVHAPSLPPPPKCKMFSFLPPSSSSSPPGVELEGAAGPPLLELRRVIHTVCHVIRSMDDDERRRDREEKETERQRREGMGRAGETRHGRQAPASHVPTPGCLPHCPAPPASSSRLPACQM